jgi:hypothetical protein
LRNEYTYIEDRIQKFGFQPKRKKSMDVHTNADAKSSAGKEEGDSTVDVARLDENLRGFAESSRVLMSVLDGVATIHPFISGERALHFRPA